jgi:hypothetical protein
MESICGTTGFEWRRDSQITNGATARAREEEEERKKERKKERRKKEKEGLVPYFV